MSKSKRIKRLKPTPRSQPRNKNAPFRREGNTLILVDIQTSMKTLLATVHESDASHLPRAEQEHNTHVVYGSINAAKKASRLLSYKHGHGTTER